MENKNVKALFERYMSRSEYEHLFSEGKNDLIEFIKNYRYLYDYISLSVKIQEMKMYTTESSA